MPFAFAFTRLTHCTLLLQYNFGLTYIHIKQAYQIPFFNKKFPVKAISLLLLLLLIGRNQTHSQVGYEGLTRSCKICCNDERGDENKSGAYCLAQIFFFFVFHPLSFIEFVCVFFTPQRWL